MWPNPQETTDLVTYAEKILNEKICAAYTLAVSQADIFGRKRVL